MPALLLISIHAINDQFESQRLLPSTAAFCFSCLVSVSVPTSSTCFHALILPQYETKAKLAHKLKLALANAVGFGLR